jgi:hypothetical protein
MTGGLRGEFLQAAQDVYLFGGFAFAEQLAERLDGARGNWRKAVQLECAPQSVDYSLLNNSPSRQPLRKPRKGFDTGQRLLLLQVRVGG